MYPVFVSGRVIGGEIVTGFQTARAGSNLRFDSSTGTFSATSLTAAGGISIGPGGIMTATTFSGTATTALNASIAYGIGGDPDIQVDSVDINGTAPTFLRGAGVSTVGAVSYTHLTLPTSHLV